MNYQNFNNMSIYGYGTGLPPKMTCKFASIIRALPEITLERLQFCEESVRLTGIITIILLVFAYMSLECIR